MKNEWKWLEVSQYAEPPKDANGGLWAIYTDVWGIVDMEDRLLVLDRQGLSPQINRHVEIVGRHLRSLSGTFVPDVVLDMKRLPIVFIPRSLSEYA